MNKKNVGILGLMAFVLALGCARTDILDVPEAGDPFVGEDWTLETIDGDTLHTIFNTNTDGNVQNSTSNRWTFAADGSWHFNFDLETSFLDTPDITLLLASTFTGTYTQEADTLSILVQDVETDAIVTPADITDTLLGREEAAFERHFAAELQTQEVFSGDYQWTLNGDQLILTAADGHELRFSRAISE